MPIGKRGKKNSKNSKTKYQQVLPTTHFHLFEAILSLTIFVALNTIIYGIIHPKFSLVSEDYVHLARAYHNTFFGTEGVKLTFFQKESIYNYSWLFQKIISLSMFVSHSKIFMIYFYIFTKILICSSLFFLFKFPISRAPVLLIPFTLFKVSLVLILSLAPPPRIISIVFFSILIKLLVDINSRGFDRKHILMFFLIFLCWRNLHIMFPIGAVLLPLTFFVLLKRKEMLYPLLIAGAVAIIPFPYSFIASFLEISGVIMKESLTPYQAESAVRLIKEGLGVFFHYLIIPGIYLILTTPIFIVLRYSLFIKRLMLILLGVLAFGFMFISIRIFEFLPTLLSFESRTIRNSPYLVVLFLFSLYIFGINIYNRYQENSELIVAVDKLREGYVFNYDCAFVGSFIEFFASHDTRPIVDGFTIWNDNSGYEFISIAPSSTEQLDFLLNMGVSQIFLCQGIKTINPPAKYSATFAGNNFTILDLEKLKELLGRN